ncbi:gliding motility lipoprotein GldH [Fontibacter flavus]|uniref:Gliding motility lipoprotein GldH n=1 Tax=Fontibacter flavus TaxID=654838 RepID=A0ABV6FPR1_9BACT
MKQLSTFLFVIILLSVFSCDGQRTFEKYEGFETQSWQIQDTVSFTMDIPVPTGPSILAVKYNEEYEFRNLYLRYLTLDSLGNVIESQLVNIPLFENTSGKPLGKGFGSTFTRYDTLPLTSHKAYHRIQFLQYMRVEDLKGVEAIGLKRVKN